MTDAVKPAPDGVVISRELLAFLCGDGPLDGHYFGEKPEHERGNFWWRKALRAAENAALEQAGEPVERIAQAIYEMNPCGEQPTDLDGRPTGLGAEIPWSDMIEYDPEYHAACMEAAKKIAPLPTLQRLGQEFDAGEGLAALLTKAIGDITVALTWAGKSAKIAEWTAPYVAAVNQFDARPPQSRGQAFDGEGEAQEDLAPLDVRVFVRVRGEIYIARRVRFFTSTYAWVCDDPLVQIDKPDCWWPFAALSSAKRGEAVTGRDGP